MADRDAPIEIDLSDGRLCLTRCRQPARQLCAPAALDRSAPTRYARRPATRSRLQPDAEIVGGEVSRRHSGLISVARITLAHFSVSSAMSLAKSEDESVNISLPNSAIRAFTVGSA